MYMNNPLNKHAHHKQTASVRRTVWFGRLRWFNGLTPVLISVQVILLWAPPSFWRMKQKAKCLNVMEILNVFYYFQTNPQQIFTFFLGFCHTSAFNTWKNTWVLAARTIFNGFCAQYVYTRKPFKKENKWCPGIRYIRTIIIMVNIQEAIVMKCTMKKGIRYW